MQTIPTHEPLDEWTRPLIGRGDMDSPISSYPEDENEIRLSPCWNDLFLHRRIWAEGNAIELRLDLAGEPASRCLIARDGQFLLGPTGPHWARELVEEAAREWSSRASE